MNKMVPLPSKAIVPERDADKLPILDVRHLGIDFGGLTAVDDFNFTMGRTDIGGLIGPNGELSDIQQAFVDEAAVQCGFCTPGFIMTAVEILESGKECTRDELRKLLSGHLCRCTGYENILNAVEKTMLRRLGKLHD